MRDELQNYGEMLALLERQQHHVIHRAFEDLFGYVPDVQQQANAIRHARNHRGLCGHAVAARLSLAQSDDCSQLIPLLPADYQPVVHALGDENTQLLIRSNSMPNHIICCSAGPLTDVANHHLLLPHPRNRCFDS